MAVLLLIEDDAKIRTAMMRALTERGHAVASQPTGMAGLRHAIDERPDLVVLDLGLPDLDGASLLRMLRSVSAVPVIVATARDDDRAVVSALDAGADDYVVKPFSADQLDARIRAVLRRTSGPDGADTRFTVGDLEVDLRSRTAVLAGRELDLRPREFDLLAYLAARPGRVFSRDQLMEAVWEYPFFTDTSTVTVHIRRLRAKLGDDSAEPRFIETVWGVGYRFKA